MASEVRVNQIQNRSGLGTVTFNENASHEGIKVQGAIGIGTFTTAVRDAGIGTASGTMLYNSASNRIEVYIGDRWRSIGYSDSITETLTYSYTGSDQALTIPASADYVTATIYAWGAGGGSTPVAADPRNGGGGGFAQATISVSPGEQFVVVVGEGGLGFGADAPGSTGTYGGGGSSGAVGYSGEGGGLSGLFEGSGTIVFGNPAYPGTPSQPRAIVIAGGGGGSGVPGNGGAGGGETGGNGTGPGTAGQGGTQSAGGTGGNPGQGNAAPPGGALFGGSPLSTGDSGGGGGGGGGYYGGGGGSNGDTPTGNNAGGGGSGYVGGHPDYATNSTLNIAGSGTDVANSSSPYYSSSTGNGASGGGNGQPGYVVIVLSD